MSTPSTEFTIDRLALLFIAEDRAGGEASGVRFLAQKAGVQVRSYDGSIKFVIPWAEWARITAFLETRRIDRNWQR